MQAHEDGYQAGTSPDATARTAATQPSQADATDDAWLVERLWEAEEQVARWRAWALARMADDAARLRTLLVAARREAHDADAPHTNRPSVDLYLALLTRVVDQWSLTGHGVVPRQPKPGPPRWEPKVQRIRVLAELEATLAGFRGFARALHLDHAMRSGRSLDSGPDPLEGVEDML